MPENRKRTVNPFIKYLTVCVTGVIVFILINCILAFITVKTPYPKENTLLSALIGIVISSFIPSFIYCFKQRQNGLVSGLIIGIIMCIILFLIYAVISSFNLNESSLLIIPSSIIPSSVAGIIAVNLKHK